jgi:hypothetical protein
VGTQPGGNQVGGAAKVAPEVWFLRRGVPSLLEGTDIAIDARRRRLVVPLSVVYVVGVAVLALSGDGTRGWGERLLAALVPAVLLLLVLVAVWVFVWTGALSIIIWLLRELTGSVGQVGVTLARTLPLLLGVVTFFFLSAELWQSMGRLRPISYTAVVLLFVGLGAAFLSSRSQLDLDVLSRFSSREEIATLLAGTSVALTAPDAPASRATAEATATDAGGEVGADASATAYVTPLGRRQRLNLRLVVALSKLTVAATVSLAVFVFFVVLGFLAVDASTVASWVQGEPRVMWTVSLLGEEFALTREHVKVAGFLAVFAGFYFAVVSATDAHLRAGLRDTAEEAVREACAARVALLHRGPKDS